MMSLTEEQWSRVWELASMLRVVPEPERLDRLRVLCGQGEDVGVLALAALQLRLPPDGSPDRKDQRVGDMTLLRPAGVGGMGIAYVGRQDLTRREVIVKLVHPALAGNQRVATRFVAEIETLGKLNWKGIAQIYGGGIHTDPPEWGGATFPYYAMELVQGQPITLYQRREKLALPELLEKFLQACDAVHYAHSMRVIHRDLKPEHILIDELTGEPRLIDFGLAEVFDPSLPRATRDFLSGTPAYMSPEHVGAAQGEVGPWSDVYALGIILYELLAGRRPYEVPLGSPEAIRQAILKARPAPLGEPSAAGGGELEAIVSRALRKDLAERYPTVAVLQRDLRRYLAALDRQRALAISTGFEGMREYQCSFGSLIARKTQEFTGRQWLVKKLDHFIETNQSGYCVLQGLPGTGKTSFAAHLVSTRGYVHHFNDCLEGITSFRHFLCTLADGIINKYRLDIARPEEHHCHDGTYLRHLLGKVSEKVIADEGRAVIVVDALDEADLPERGRNILYLPATLPAGVFFVLTRREMLDFPLHVEPPLEEVLLENEADNARDIRSYLEQVAQRPSFAARLRALGRGAADFVSLMQQKAENNFMYLYHVLPEVERGEYPDLTPDLLPQGLKGYYERHWQKMRGEDSDRWCNFLLPVICVLAVAREPLSVQEVHTYVARGFPEFKNLNRIQVREVIRSWREFLWESSDQGLLCFRIYHTSFQDFLRKKDEIGEEIDFRNPHEWISHVLGEEWAREIGDHAGRPVP